MKKLNETNIEICSISDDDEIALGLINKQIKSEPSNSLHIDLGQQSISSAAFGKLSTAFANTEAQDTSFQLQPQRPSKLLRTRAPVNQTKPKDDDMILIETSLMILDESPPHSSNIHQPSTSSKASIPITTDFPFMPQHTSSTAAVASTSSGRNSNHHQLLSFLPSTSSTILQPSMSKFARDSLPTVQDGRAILTMVQPANGSTNNNCNSNNITEPELVLSPANLGQ